MPSACLLSARCHFMSRQKKAALHPSHISPSIAQAELKFRLRAAQAMMGGLHGGAEVVRLERIFTDEVAASRLDPFARPVTLGPPAS